MTDYFKEIVKKAYDLLFTAYFSDTKAQYLMARLDWELLLTSDWQAFLEEKRNNPAYTENDYLDLIWEADVYAIVENYSNETV
ncbi:hypothetical protein [Fructobacillus fructosus]|uniref:hypothetical protein n=1 Tax=Fructobacillus fructosus TaxID=1631 RepID=UPI001658BABC|nr:hypothetical protein [Fructobacillus fructosus]MBC9119425.1 hypothetical protein [Fructobacillus fructosus]MBD9367011.1 hypothetical protein [Leuconostoc mesenteroides]